MSFQKNNNGEKALRRQAATMLIRLATIMQNLEKSEYQTKPEPSKPGEHLRFVTGNARDQLVYYPESVEEVMQTMEVRVFYQLNAWYAAWWESPYNPNRRKGLAEKFMQLKESGIVGKLSGNYEGY